MADSVPIVLGNSEISAGHMVCPISPSPHVGEGLG
jgi:hypothetical protein